MREMRRRTNSALAKLKQTSETVSKPVTVPVIPVGPVPELGDQLEIRVDEDITIKLETSVAIEHGFFPKTILSTGITVSDTLSLVGIIRKATWTRLCEKRERQMQQVLKRKKDAQEGLENARRKIKKAIYKKSGDITAARRVGPEYWRVKENQMKLNEEVMKNTARTMEAKNGRRNRVYNKSKLGDAALMYTNLDMISAGFQYEMENPPTSPVGPVEYRFPKKLLKFNSSAISRLYKKHCFRSNELSKLKAAATERIMTLAKEYRNN